MTSGYDVVIVGAGLAGLVVARGIVTGCGASVLIRERSEHLGGLLRSERDERTAVEYNPHGTRVIATSDRSVVDYLSRWESLVPYRHMVHAAVAGALVPMPVGLEAIELCYQRALGADEARDLVQRDAAPYAGRAARTVEDVALAALGAPLYEMFVRGYVRKQWGADPAELDAEVFNSRFGVCYERGRGYYDRSTWQLLPQGGYGRLLRALADHPRIDIEYKCGQIRWDSHGARRLCVATGFVDDFFDHRFGRLGRRAVGVEWRHVDAAARPGGAVLTHPTDGEAHYRTHVPEFLPWSRGAARDGSVLVGHERHDAPEHRTEFVLNGPADRALAERYRRHARTFENLVLTGRGTTFYDDIATTVTGARALGEELAGRLGGSR
ncbi:UDP-galactopyranose mutase [Streptomyces sp. NPDC059629]|uniref:UDP-galactopyranose mutase n=1 Tax=Streptomyces sp. NPDC059629 TaxID=3346889 RepID=UPI0036B55F2A